MYGLNLIDTPGHVDFSYEVSRSLQACEGAILVVDAAQGIEAQTLANVHLALAQDLVIVPVINKIDLPSAQPEVVMQELEDVLAIPREEVILVSAKDGTNVDQVLEAIVARVPAPKGDPGGAGPGPHLRLPLRRLQGRGRIRPPGRRHAPRTREHPAHAVGRRGRCPGAGHVPTPAGTRSTGWDRARWATSPPASRASATARWATRSPRPPNPATDPLPGYKQARSLVFAGIYPIDGPDYPLLRDALEKLHLNDATITYEPESSVALGFGFRCGFLGLLHMEIIQERLEREFDLDLIASAPSVEYHVTLTNGRGEVSVDNPSTSAGPVGHRSHRGAVGEGLHHHPVAVHRDAHGPRPGPPGCHR